MNRMEELETLKQDYQNVTAPEGGIFVMKKTMEKAKSDKAKKNRYRLYQTMGAAAAVILLITIPPNVSASAAMAMEKIPLLGSVVKVITLRNYTYEDGHSNANVSVPLIEAEGSTDGAQQINTSVEDYTNMILEQFEAEQKEIGEGYQGLDISYEVVTDNDIWFTLRLDILQVQASGFQQEKYYHIDKSTGKTASLKNIFAENSDYMTIISDNIKEQMRTRMATEEGVIYWLDNPDQNVENFESIGENQNFYFDTDGNLVIAFDEYAVAPGFMGVCQFVIPKDILPMSTAG